MNLDYLMTFDISMILGVLAALMLAIGAFYKWVLIKKILINLKNSFVSTVNFITEKYNEFKIASVKRKERRAELKKEAIRNIAEVTKEILRFFDSNKNGLKKIAKKTKYYFVNIGLTLLSLLIISFFVGWENTIYVVEVIACLGLIFLVACYFWLAELKLFFSFGKENAAQFKMEANGNVWTKKLIFLSDGEYVDPENGDLLPITEDTPKHLYKKRNFYGMYWVGIPPFKSILKYHFVWQEWKLVPETTDGVTKNVLKLVLRDEDTNYLFTKRFPYGMMLSAAENKGGEPTDVGMMVFLKAINVKKPIFGNVDAYGQIQGLILGIAAEYVKTKTFADIYGEKAVAGGLNEPPSTRSEFSQIICLLNDNMGEEVDTFDSEGNKTGTRVIGIKEKFGFEIQGVKIMTVDLTGKNSLELIEAETKVAIAKQEALAEVERADGIAKGMDKITDAKEKRYAVLDAHPESYEVEKAEKMFGEHSKLTTLAGGAVPTITLK